MARHLNLLVLGCWYWRCAAASAAASEAQQALEARRGRQQLDRPDSLAEAAAQHAAALQAARGVERSFGHVRPAAGTVAAARALAVAPSGGPGGLIYATDYGADPSGAKDSTAALQRAMAAVLALGRTSGRTMASNISDLGGATLDLAGGQYLISSPLVIPPFVGNTQIMRGTLRASKSFPRDKWLVMIGDKTCQPLLPSGQPDRQASCNEFINLSEMLFDAAHVAAGGVYVAKVMGTTIGPSAFFTGFTEVGIRIDAGHEVMIQQTWLAEYYWSEAGHKHESKSIGIQINGNDHYLTDVIVFDFTSVGVEVNGAANILQNVHTWNGGGVGIAVHGGSNRLMGCYLDFNKLVISNPASTVVESSFFLQTNAVLKADKPWRIDGLRFAGNTYATKGPSIELDGNFTAGSIDISGEVAARGAALKLSRARRSLHRAGAAQWAFDFSDVLLLPTIDEVMYSFVSDSDEGFVRHVARRPMGTRVVVETDVPASGTVVMEVRQGIEPQTCSGRSVECLGVRELWL